MSDAATNPPISVPPWQWVTPCPPPLSLAWRMAPGEAFIEAWLDAVAALDGAALDTYLREHDAPEAWRSWVVGITVRPT